MDGYQWFPRYSRRRKENVNDSNELVLDFLQVIAKSNILLDKLAGVIKKKNHLCVKNTSLLQRYKVVLIQVGAKWGCKVNFAFRK